VLIVPIVYDLYPYEIAELTTERLEQLCAERTAKIEELQTLIGVFREKIAAKEEHSELFRDNLASIQCSIEDLEDSCVRWQQEIDDMKAELKKRRGDREE
jgi:predicted  nucleic acid-binding Zn-ribbon protein